LISNEDYLPRLAELLEGLLQASFKQQADSKSELGGSQDAEVIGGGFVEMRIDATTHECGYVYSRAANLADNVSDHGYGADCIERVSGGIWQGRFRSTAIQTGTQTDDESATSEQSRNDDISPPRQHFVTPSNRGNERRLSQYSRGRRGNQIHESALLAINLLKKERRFSSAFLANLKQESVLLY
jgi:hypothetical protein